MPKLTPVSGNPYLPQGLLDALARVESSNNPRAVSPKGATGLFQFMPATAQQYGIDPRNPGQARQGAERYMTDLMQQFDGDLPTALAAWNWGPGNVRKHGVHKAPAETRNFISKVMRTINPIGSAEAGERTMAESKLTPVDYDPFKAPDAKLTPVDFNPFAPKTKPAAKSSLVLDRARKLPQRGTMDWDIRTPINEARAWFGEQGNNLPLVDRVVTGVAGGINDVVSGARQLLGRDTPEDAQNRAFIDRVGENSLAATGGRVAGNVIATLPLAAIPGAQSASALTRMGNAAAQGTAAGGLMYTKDGESRAQNVLVGGLAGAGVSGAMSAAGKVVNAKRGVMKTPRLQEMRDLSRQHDVRLSAGDMTGSRFAKSSETMLENVPVVGTASFRRKQAGEALQAAQRATQRFNPQGRVEDVGEELQGSLQRVLKANKAQAATHYDAVEEALQQPGVVNRIQPQQTKQAVTDLLKEYPDIFDRLPSDTVKQKLAVIASDLAPTVEQPKILLPGGKPQAPTIKPAELTFEDARFLRTQLNNYISRAAKSGGAVGSDELRRLMQVKSGLESDIEQWAQRNGNAQVKKAFDTANQYYRDRVAPFRDNLINKATGQDIDTDTIFKTFVKPERGKLAGKLAGNLDAQGQQALKYGVLKQAFDTAFDSNQQNFSPRKFAAQLERLERANAVIFTPKEKSYLDGLTKLMNAAQRSGQYMENVPTGNRVVQGMLSTGGLTASIANPTLLPVIAKAYAGAGGLAFLLTNDYGKRLLLSASKVKLGSKTMDMLLRQARNHLPRAASGAGIQTNHQSTPAQ